jgi:CheY-like chemotaxis protein
MVESRTVLVVDDNRGMLLTLQRILADEGYRVLVAEDGASALDIAEREPIDFALVDYRMTGMNGGEVCARLSGRQPAAVVYMMTAHVNPEAAAAAVENGAAGILYKPLDIPALLATFASGRRATWAPATTRENPA